MGRYRLRGLPPADPLAPRPGHPCETCRSPHRAEIEAFLSWLADDHFTLLGYNAYTLETGVTGVQLRRVEGAALGILRAKDDGELSAEECEDIDGRNVMFWVSGSFRQRELSEWQRRVIELAPVAR